MLGHKAAIGMSSPVTRRARETVEPARPTTSIVLATLNERDNILPLVRRIRAVGLKSYEMVFVDDGSTDGTVECLAVLAGGDPSLRLVSRSVRRTLAEAQIEGIGQSTGDYVVVMDADLQHPPETLPLLIGELDRGVDLCVGSRYAPGASTGGRSPYRAVISLGAEMFARLLVPEARGVSDPISGFFCFRRAVYRFPSGRVRGYKPLLFLLVLCGGRHVSEVPYSFNSRVAGSSKITHNFGFVRVFVREVLAALRLHIYLARTVKPSRPAVPSPPVGMPGPHPPPPSLNAIPPSRPPSG